MTMDPDLPFTAGHDMWTTHSDADTPALRMADGPMGIASGRVDERDVSVLTPSGIALAATWDRQMVAQVGALVGGEARRRGVDLVLAPNLNLVRSPNAGRVFEMFGEDPVLAGTLGASWIEGLQSRNVGAVAKHLVCNDSETDRDRYDVIVDEVTLHERYLMPFEMAARAGCAGLMTAYNKVNGEHCSQSRAILTDVVRDEWRYDGFTVSDWFGTHSGAASLNAGLDLEMPGPARFMGHALSDALRAGEVGAAQVSAASSRVKSAARRWAGGDAGEEPGDRDTVLKEAAAASFTLLRNDGKLLPLDPASGGTLAVIGPNALMPCFQGGTFAKISVRPDAVTPVEALAARFGAGRVTFAQGCPLASRLPPMPAMPVRTDKDGAVRGMTVEYYGDHDFTAEPIGMEVRDTNSLTWFQGLKNIGAFDRPGGVRASGIVAAGETGTYRFHVGGTGSITLRVNGHEVFAAERHIEPRDIMGVLKAGHSEIVDVELAAGTSALVEVELRYQAARAQGLWFGLDAPEDPKRMLAEAEATARAADTVLLLVGETADAGVESKDRATTALSADQRRLVEAVTKANPKTIVAVNVGHAFDTTFASDAATLMAVWYPGEQFGPALAAVIAGDLEPSGRLPVSLACSEAGYPVLDTRPEPDETLPYGEGVHVGYRGMSATATAFCFGHGLGYGQVSCDEARAEATAEGGICIAVAVANTAPRDTAAVVQAYREDGALVGFARRTMAANSAGLIEISVDPIALRRRAGGKWERRIGAVTLHVGTSRNDLPLSITVNL